MVDELTEITRELLASPIDEFTAQRNARVRELKRSGAGALAAEVQQLRRPALPLWLANQLAAQPALLGAVREATLAAAQAQLWIHSGPPAVLGRWCQACSLREPCLPRVTSDRRSASRYLATRVR